MSTLNFLPTLTGCFAQPVAENPTVVMMEAAFKYHGLHYLYVNMDVGPQDLEMAVKGAKAQGYIGFNCSLPHKVEVIQYLDELGESAKLIGAVNCAVKQPDGRWIGENTDGKGFLHSLYEVIDPMEGNIVLIGAGGAARAIAVELALAGAAKITLCNRSEKRGMELVKHLREHTQVGVEFVSAAGDYSVSPDTDVVVNATSIGLYPEVDALPAINLESLKPHMVVADVIPNPPQTRLLKEAASRGCMTLDGLGMLVNQGVANIYYWTGLEVNRAVMRKALEAVFAS